MWLFWLIYNFKLMIVGKNTESGCHVDVLC